MLQTLVILEPNFSGHRGTYVDWISEHAQAKFSNIVVATLAVNRAHPIAHRLQKRKSKALRLVTIDRELPSISKSGIFNLIRLEIAYRRLMKELYAASIVDQQNTTVIVPYLDCCLNGFALFGVPFKSSRWAGIVMRQVFHLKSFEIRQVKQPVDYLKEYLFLRILQQKKLNTIFSIDELLVSYLKNGRGLHSANIVSVVDPANGSKKDFDGCAKSKFGIDADKFVILLYGGIAKRKGVLQAILAIHQMDVDRDFCLIVAGKQDAEVKKALETPVCRSLIADQRLIIVDRFLSTSDESLVFSAADCVWLGYIDFLLSSGVLVLAGRWGLPVIAANVGLIGYQVRQYALGELVDPLDVGSVRQAFFRLRDNAELRERYGDNGEKKFSQSTPRAFVETILDSIAQPSSD